MGRWVDEGEGRREKGEGKRVGSVELI